MARCRAARYLRKRRPAGLQGVRPCPFLSFVGAKRTQAALVGQSLAAVVIRDILALLLVAGDGSPGLERPRSEPGEHPPSPGSFSVERGLCRSSWSVPDTVLSVSVRTAEETPQGRRDDERSSETRRCPFRPRDGPAHPATDGAAVRHRPGERPGASAQRFFQRECDRREILNGSDRARRCPKRCNLDAIVAVGCRVRVAASAAGL